MTFDVRKIFATRIGGEKFGKTAQTWKFTAIDNAKREFIANNPDINVIDMGVGEPEELPPLGVTSRLIDEAKRKSNRIYPCNGTLEFRESAARYLAEVHGITCDPATEMMHCIGTKSALAQIPLAFVNPGDVVLYTTPGYPVLPKVSEWLGAKLYPLKLEGINSFLPDMKELIQVIERDRPKLLLLNYPNNPSGATASRSFYERMIELAHLHNFVIVQDAAYADLCFDGPYMSPLALPGGKEVTLELFSLSKSFNMQGYRLGFVAGSADLVKAFSLVKDNTDNGQFIAIQKAGMEAVERQRDFLTTNRDKYKRRIEEVAGILSSAGIPCVPSSGTFYLYVPVPERFADRSFESATHFSQFLLGELGIVSVPWDDAGAYVRFSMTFEVGVPGFATEEDVFSALKERLFAASKRVQ